MSKRLCEAAAAVRRRELGVHSPIKHVFDKALAAALVAALPLSSSAIGPRLPDDPPVERAVPSAPTPISRETAWAQLLPKDEREHFTMIPPPPLHDYLSGDQRVVQTGSTAVNAALNGSNISLPGFIVPLTLTKEGLVSDFFLVPYVGACIHVPPPPPNQMVYVKLAKAMPLNLLYDPYWVTGTLRTLDYDNQLGAAAYSMTASRVEPYKS